VSSGIGDGMGIASHLGPVLGRTARATLSTPTEEDPAPTC
jgi:hypothetical protein